MTLTDFQRELGTSSRWNFSDLRALYVNCTLKPSPERSHTEGLMRISMAIMEANGVAVELVRAVDHKLAPGVWPDMREHGPSATTGPTCTSASKLRTSSCSAPRSGSARSRPCARVSWNGCTRARACSTSMASTRITARSQAA